MARSLTTLHDPNHMVAATSGMTGCTAAAACCSERHVRAGRHNGRDATAEGFFEPLPNLVGLFESRLFFQPRSSACHR